MNGPSERDEIAAVAGIIAAARLRAAKDDASPALTAARAILASDWLAERDRRTAAKTWDDGWKAAQELVDFEGRRVWAHTLFPEGYEGNPYTRGGAS